MKMNLRMGTGATLAIAMAICAPIHANVGMKLPFASSMVLQRGMPIPVWGTAAANENVTVILQTKTKVLSTKTVLTPSSGNWTVKLDVQSAAGPLELVARSANNTVTFNDVYVGEVWHLSGQSNMQTTLKYYLDIANWCAECKIMAARIADSIKTADVPLLRFYDTKTPLPWMVTTPKNVDTLSAAGYFFGKAILAKTGVAVGLIVTAVGGTKVESWMDPATLKAHPEIAEPDNGKQWNANASKIVGYGIRGTAWVQGEANSTTPALANAYAARFKLLIQGWRKAWGQGDFPFYFGQLSYHFDTDPPVNTPNEVSEIATVREAQRQALTLPNTAMSVNIDQKGCKGCWHFPNKIESGRRLALPALALLYGQTDLVYSGPLYSKAVATGNQVKVLFKNIGGGLVATNGTLEGFAMAGSTGAWVWATSAVIKKDTVILSNPAIAKPTRVRYAWSDHPAASLANKEGLLAAPFSTEADGIPVGLSDRSPLEARSRPSVLQGVLFDPSGRRNPSVTLDRLRVLYSH